MSTDSNKRNELRTGWPDRNTSVTRWSLPLILAFVCFAIATTNTFYVGDLTIYRESDAQTRVHHSVLHNAMPDGGWAANGSNGINVRVFTIYLAEGIHWLSGMEIGRIYRLIDHTFIALTLYLAFWFFRSFASTSTALIGILYIAAFLPLTYAFYRCHPWDRVSWCVWLLALWAVKDNRPYALGIITIVGITIKHDILAIVGLYFLVWVTWSNWRSVTVTTAAIALLGIATYGLLRYWLPGGLDADRASGLVIWMKRLYWQFCRHPLDHPAVLAFTSLVCIAPFGLKSSNRFALASFGYGLILLLYISWVAIFIEFRAQMGFMLLFMPLVLLGLERIFEADSHHPFKRHASIVPPDYGS